jgi:hypothetical protein
MAAGSRIPRRTLPTASRSRELHSASEPRELHSASDPRAARRQRTASRTVPANRENRTVQRETARTAQCQRNRLKPLALRPPPRLPTPGGVAQGHHGSRLLQGVRALCRSLAMHALREGRPHRRGGAIAPWTLPCGRSLPKGNPPRAQAPHRRTRSCRKGRALGERRAGAGAARDRFGTVWYHRDPCLTPGPTAAVSFPGGLECQSGTD